MSTQPVVRDSDSEDDEYIPPAEAESSESSDEERDAKRQRVATPPPTEQDEAEKKKARDVLWSSFEASITQIPSQPAHKAEMVKIEKRFRYAGETVVEVVEVPADSSDAKTWPLWREAGGGEGSSQNDSEKSTELASSDLPSGPSAVKKPPPKRRKSKVTLAAIPTAASHKAKKLSTLEKSAMDWQAHIRTSQDSGLKDELEAHRRGGGYLEKVEFLNRVEGRREGVFEANKSSKRRKP